MVFIDFISSTWVMNWSPSPPQTAVSLWAHPAQQTETNNNSLKYLCLQRESVCVCVSVAQHNTQGFCVHCIKAKVSADGPAGFTMSF